MRAATYKTTDAEEVLDKVFTFLVKQGLENASVREICKGTGIVQGSLYYWFEDKTKIICEATKYGLEKVTDEIFKYVFSSIDDLQGFFENILDHVSIFKNELRFIYQMVASPKYGAQIRCDGKYFKSMYDQYAVELAERLGYDIDRVKPIVYLLVSAILDYAVWDDVENVKCEIDFISSIASSVFARSPSKENELLERTD